MATLADTYRLSLMQQGMLFHHLDSRTPGVDIEQILCTLREAVDLDAFERAWGHVVARHPSLRVSFRWDDVAQPLQDVHSELALPFEILDWRGLSAGEQQRKLEEHLAEDRRRGFALATAPLMRFAVFRFGEADYRFLWSFHHILQDGRSFPIVLNEAFAAYGALRQGREPDLPPLPPFREFIDWLYAQDREGQEAFWRRRLSGFRNHTSLAVARPPRGGVSERGERELRLSKDLSDRMRGFAERYELSVNTLLLGAWAVLLSRYSGEDDVVFGATRACRQGTVEGADAIPGLFINTLPVRTEVRANARLVPWLRQLRAGQLEVRPYEHTPLFDVQRWSDVEPGAPLFETIVVFDYATLNHTLRSQGGEWEGREFQLLERTTYALTLYGYGDPELLLKLAYDRDRFDDATCERMLCQLATMLEGTLADPRQNLGSLRLLDESEEHRILEEWNQTETEYPRETCIHELFEQQARRTPDAVAVSLRDRELSYRELDEQANQLAHHLRGIGVGPDALVGLFMDRSLELMVGLLGILKAGGAYLPLDPTYPKERLAFMLEDAKIGVLLIQDHLSLQLPSNSARVVRIDGDRQSIVRNPTDKPDSGVTPDRLAYVIYTSGSTGRPKGVMVEHRNVVNFFTGMDEALGRNGPGVWLAVTSLSFDISVLELFWTLARGFKVVLYSDEHAVVAADETSAAAVPLDFSLFYFASGEGGIGEDKYRLLLEGAKFADRNGFAAVWTPERHFHAFGGLYPNPSVAGAAIAVLTENVQIRSGSVVLPLHHPIRVAEEWSLVDNLSGGRVGISVAAGWQPNDFVLAPQNYADRKALMFRHIDIVRRLWRGEALAFPDANGKPVEVRTLPRPIQPELPVWVTTAGNAETYRMAGEHGANVLTHLLGQTVEELEEKIVAYREAYRESRIGRGRGHVSLVLHTFLGGDIDEVREIVRQPMVNYLRSAVSLVKNFALAWTAYRGARARPVKAEGDEFQLLSEKDMNDLLNFAFERYFETSGLFGTPDSCMQMLRRLKAVDVDEVACLIDFGVDPELALEHLDQLGELRRRANAGPVVAEGPESIPELIARHGVTHLQCTPTMARMLVLHPESRAALGSLQKLMVGGEAFPVPLARELERLVPGDIINMYGPTETTIWSAVHPVRGVEDTVPIGRPIANTNLYVLDHDLQPLPVGVPGELFIGGAGVVRGYLDRPELTHERFIPHPFSDDAGARLYRTGDLVRYRNDGVLEFLGRTDFQVKIRGHRIELGEIETRLGEHPDVRENVVVAKDYPSGDTRLVAYVVCHPGHKPSVNALRGHLQERVPDYMVPSVYAFMDSLPLTPNKKVDRKALPDPEGARPDIEQDFVGPRTDVEKALAELWSDVLGVERVGLHDSFFDLGGHSLTAVQLTFRIRKRFGVEFPMRSFFKSPTLADVACALEDMLLSQADPAELDRLVTEAEQLSEEEIRARLREQEIADSVAVKEHEGG